MAAASQPAAFPVALLQFTRLSRALAGLLVAGYLTQLVSPSTRQYLALVPGRFIPCIWNVITAGFLQTSLLKVGASLLSCCTLPHEVSAVKDQPA